MEGLLGAEPDLGDLQQDWLRASAYDLYDTLVSLDELLNADRADIRLLQASASAGVCGRPGAGGCRPRGAFA